MHDLSAMKLKRRKRRMKEGSIAYKEGIHDLELALKINHFHLLWKSFKKMET
jgi:hypothetical protein